MLDADHNGYLDFKEFQQAIDLVGARLPDDRLRWSFRLYDMDNSGSIALNEMEGVFECIYNMFEVSNLGDPSRHVWLLQLKKCYFLYVYLVQTCLELAVSAWVPSVH